MSSFSTKPPGGTRDFQPSDVARRRYVVGVVQQIFESYGFVPIETPAIENLSTLLGKYGDEGDRLIFRLLHRGKALERALEAGRPQEADLADQGLRYDLTVPLARFVAAHSDLPRYFKRYQIQPVWRADRPGRGRLREFYQCDVDIVGTDSAVADAEVAAAVAQVLQALGFKRFTLRLNHRALLRAMIGESGIGEAMESSALVAVDKLDKVGIDGVRAELVERGVAEDSARRLLELIDPGRGGENAATLSRLRERIGDPAGLAALAELETLMALLENTPAAGHVRCCPELARGLGYYTGPIFEITVEDLAGSLGGGGRYDGLVGMFGKREIPATGFSLGLERILLVMAERGLYPELAGGPNVMLCSIGVDGADALRVAHRLREQGLRIEVFPQAAKLGKQIQYADELGIPFVAILGDSELESDEVTVKHLASGNQRRIEVDEVARSLEPLKREA